MTKRKVANDLSEMYWCYKLGTRKEKIYVVSMVSLLIVISIIITILDIAFFPVVSLFDKQYRFTKKWLIGSLLWSVTMLPFYIFKFIL